MSTRAAATQAAVAAPLPITAVGPGSGLQRKCVCGGSAGMSETCAECQQKKLLGKPLQTKLRINEPGDVYEQEADRVAEQVMRMPAAGVNRPRRESGSPLVQRRATGGGTGVLEAPPIVHDVLHSPGHPLDAATRAFFELRFGHDFSRVRIHADEKAAQSARVIHARAYTVGQRVVFAEGQYRPTTEGGASLLAHELTHTIQQAPRSSRGGSETPFEIVRRQEPSISRQEDEISRILRGPVERARRFEPRLRPHVPRAPLEPAAPMPRGSPRCGVTPCNQSPACSVHIPGSAWDFVHRVGTAEERTRQSLGAQAAIRPSTEFASFVRTVRPRVFNIVAGINVNPALDAPDQASAQVGPCRVGNPPRTTRGACIEIPGYAEEGARQFNAGQAEIPADQRCVERARDLERESLVTSQAQGRNIQACDRDLWSKWEQRMLDHELGHEEFDRLRLTPIRTVDQVSQFELNELFANLSEWPQSYRWAARQRVSEARRQAYLRDQVDEMVTNGREDIRGMLRKLRCLNPCNDVNAAVRAVWNAVSASWPPEMRTALLRELTDPERHLGWLVPPPPAAIPVPMPERPRFGPLYEPRRDFRDRVLQSVEDLP